MATSSYVTNWQPKVRGMAKVDDTVVKQGADKEEGEAVRNAVSSYSKLRPRKLTYKGEAPASDTIILESLVEGWLPATHSLANVYTPDRRTKVDGNELDTYVNEDGKEVLWLASQPTGELWLEFTAPHVVTDQPDTDTVSAEAPGDLHAICHLAASYILMMAANEWTKIARSSISADAINYDQLAAKAKVQADAERAEYNRHMGIVESGSGSAGGTSTTPYSGRVDWDSRTTGGSDRFAHRAKWF